ncbi:hypothetical protein AAP_00657 [Ascosphaera apis ARSEF 7405]|uniref:G domain-containing protein n=1 Tax=Ascosphaera apis ARSEF 7405 TaxID=392613 RepID=A0A168CU22_9EURO|nr:hypothetical protein AAP_00657 [Ascosphaera apis ARSEF 7405]
MLPRRSFLLRTAVGSRSLSWLPVRSRLASQWAATSLAARPGASTPLRRTASLYERRGIGRNLVWNQHRRWASTAVVEEGEEYTIDDDDVIPFEHYRQEAPANTNPAALPVSCPGCGAFTQWVYPDEAGFYTLTRKTVRSFLKAHPVIEHPAVAESEAAKKETGDITTNSIAPTIEDGIAAPITDETDSVERQRGSHETGSDNELSVSQQMTKSLNEENAEDDKSLQEDTISDVHVPQQDTSEGGVSSSAQDVTAIGTISSLSEAVPDPPLQKESSLGGIEGKIAEELSTKDEEQSKTLDELKSSTLNVDDAIKPNSTVALASHELKEKIEVPVCDRCHNLRNHGIAPPIPSPPLSYIRELLEESPYQYNHVYHIIDAADFPLTLIPNIYKKLDLQQQRSKNRRSRLSKFEEGHRKSVVSFVITRSDLLAATKEQVDHLMPYIVNLLRRRLGLDGDRVRLGNVHMVSAHRGWWTKEIKEKIRDHAGGVWMVGKTNVGKSNLLSVIFPKERPAASNHKRGTEPTDNSSVKLFSEPVLEDTGSLLPPPQPETNFPVFPIVSSMPGTTALPVRIPLTHRRGEVIDLPGLSRGGLEPYVRDEWLNKLVIQKRVKPERLTIKPGQSLLLGELIRITPLDPDIIILAAPFVNMPSHVTATPKAVSLQTQEDTLQKISVAKDGIGADIASAGVFKLNDDVTKVYGQYDRFGNSLPYAVMATDILVEGCGWVEIIAQIRRKQLEAGFVPQVEIFSPKGRFVASRPSMCAYSFELEKKQKTARQNKSRPRKSMRRARLTSLGPLKKSS